MKFQLFIFCILLILNCSNLQAQTRIKGMVKDTTGQPIPFASILLTNSYQGTITNLDGLFELIVPEQNQKSEVTISCIGYQNLSISLDSLQKVPTLLQLTLRDKSYQLKEIVVNKQNLVKNPEKIMANAIKQTPSLLDLNGFIGKYYFRQTHKLDTSINRLIEAAISIYDPGHDIADCRFNIDQLKSSLDNRKIDYDLLLQSYLYSRKKKYHQGDSRIKANSSYQDTLIQKYLLKDLDHSKASFSKFFITTNMIRGIQSGKRKKSLRINPHFKNGRPIITDSFIKEHQFKLDTILLYNNDAVYKIKILPNKKYPQIKFQEHGLIPIGTAYIRVKDYAILDLDYGYISNPNRKYYKPSSKFYFHFKIKLTEFNEKLYLNYLYSDRFDYNSKLSRDRRVIQEFSLSEIISDQDTISKQLNTLNWKSDHYEKLPYNKEFWDNYSTMLPTNEERLLKENLIKEIQKKKNK